MFDNPTLAEIAAWPPRSEHPVTKVKALWATEITLTVLLTIVLILRYSSRLLISRAFTVDDWMIIPAYIFTVAFNITCIITGFYGWGWHVWDIPFLQLVPMLRLIYISIPLFVIANTTIKISILLFYRRIFCTGGTAPRFDRLLKASIVFIVVWGFVYLILGIVICTPIHAAWNLLHIPGQRCHDDVGYQTHGATDVALDVYLLILPQWKIWRLKIPLRQRVAVGVVMSFAALAVAAGVMRMPYIWKMTSSESDKTWTGMEMMIWGSVELTLGIGCASAPALRAFFTKKNAPALVGRVHSMRSWGGNSLVPYARRVDGSRNEQTIEEALDDIQSETVQTAVITLSKKR